jgi:hypothetical protein
MAVEEIRTQPPRQAKRENPDGRKPHSRVVVQITCIDQLDRPCVETGQPRMPARRAVYVAAQATVAVKGGEIPFQPGAVAVPDLRATFEPTLEIAAPDYLLNELFGLFRPMHSQCRSHGIGFQHQSAPDVR